MGNAPEQLKSQYQFDVDTKSKGFYQKIYEFLVEDDSDESTFQSILKLCHGRSIIALSKFRMKKIKDKNISFSDFYSLFCVDKQIALQSLFQQPIYFKDIVYLDELLLNKSISVRKMYDEFIKTKGIFVQVIRWTSQ